MHDTRTDTHNSTLIPAPARTLTAPQQPSELPDDVAELLVDNPVTVELSYKNDVVTSIFKQNAFLLHSWTK